MLSRTIAANLGINHAAECDLEALDRYTSVVVRIVAYESTNFAR